jgi:hypothetical protein
MPDTIPNLWPEQFKIDVQSPVAILRVQAVAPSKVTRGILEGTVETESVKELVQHRLVVVAPAYNGYRHTLISVLHNPNLPYPAEVRAEGLAEEVARRNDPVLGLSTKATGYPKAHDDEQMQALVQRALNSEPTKAVILSLIAKSNEANPPPTPPGNGEARQEGDAA